MKYKVGQIFEINPNSFGTIEIINISKNLSNDGSFVICFRRGQNPNKPKDYYKTVYDLNQLDYWISNKIIKLISIDESIVCKKQK